MLIYQILERVLTSAFRSEDEETLSYMLSGNTSMVMADLPSADMISTDDLSTKILNLTSSPDSYTGIFIAGKENTEENEILPVFAFLFAERRRVLGLNSSSRYSPFAFSSRYEDFDVKLRGLGAQIEKVSSERELQKFKLRVG